MKKTKMLGLIIVFFMVLQLIIPLNFTGAAISVSQDCIKKVSVFAQSDGSLKDITSIADYQPQNGDSVTLKLDIELDAGHDYGDGSKLTYELPSIFTNAYGSGNLGTVGNFKIEDGKVVVTFNGSIRDDANQGVAVNDASFSVGANYSETNELLEYTLKIPGQENIQLNFKPIGGNSIIKDGTPENGGISSNFISWIVDVNTSLDTLSNTIFKDELIQGNPGNHTYIQDSLSVIELNVNAKGEVSPGDPTTPAAITAVYNSENTELTFELPDGNKAYRISYKTRIDENDSNYGSATYKNKASLTNNGVTVSDTNTPITVTWGSPLEKSVSRSNSFGASANWTVKYNYNRKTIPKDTAILVDKITGNHKIDASTIKVYSENNTEIDGSMYNVVFDEDGKGYILTFNQDVTEPYQIKYTSNKTDYFEASGSVSNTVTRQNDGKQSTSNFTYSNPAIAKSAVRTDYDNKTIEWQIKVNQDSYPMDNIVITDTYNGMGMKYKADTLAVTGLAEGQYTFTDNGTSGFVFSVTTGTTISSPFTIKFTTDYTINDIGTNNRTYKNTSAIKWYVGVKEYNSSSTATANIDAKQKANGYKNGAYNYETKKFKWTSLINFNKNTLDDAIFKDTLPETQTVDISSIVVRPVTLNANGSIGSYGESITPLNITTNETKNEFEIALGEITGPYEITYTSVDTDGIFPKTDGNVKIKNSAQLLDGETVNSSWSDEVTVAYTNETIKKEGSGFNNTSLINWNFKLNYSQSELSDVTIVDTVGKDSDGNPNQLILEDSFKVYKVTLTGDMKSGTPTETKTLVTGGYNVNIDNENGKFTLTFNNPISNAYYIEYQAIFLGAPNENLSNTANLTYNIISNKIEEISSKNFDYWFSGSGSTKKVQLKIIKTDEDSGEKLQGAKFELYNSNNIKLIEGTTDENGVLLFPYKLGEGKYKLKEVEAPTGYLKNSIQEIELKLSSSAGGIQTETITDTKIYQTIELSKTDDENNPLEGVEFELLMKNVEGNYNIVSGYENLKTNSEGKIYLGDLLTPGDYQLVETKAKEGYWLDTTPVKFTVVKDQTEPVSKTVINSRQGNIIINKVDALDNKPLQGALFKLYDVNDTTFVEPMYMSTLSDENGVATFENVKYGEYLLRETIAPSNYVVKPSDNGKVIVVNSASNEITIKNEKINQAVKLTKVDADNNYIKLKGAVYKLYKSNGTLVTQNKDGDALPETFVTGEFGEIEVNKLSPGNYYFDEIESPDYYLKPTGNNSKTEVFTITEGQTAFTDVEKTNKRGNGSIIVTKVDSANNEILLNGVEFILVSDDNSITKVLTTNVNGKIEFSDLPYGTYSLTENIAHPDYVISNTPIDVLLNGNTDGIEIALTLENTKKDHSVKLIKYNSSKSLTLQGAVFELRKEKDGVYEVVGGIDEGKLTTDVNGEINLTDLEAGKYQLIEVKSPSNYKLNSEPVEFEILENQITTITVEKLNNKKSSGGGGGAPETPSTPETPVVPETPAVPDDPKDPVLPNEPDIKPSVEVGNILINKVDENQYPLGGAKFTLYDKDGVAIKNVVSDINGTVLFDNLQLGNYSVRETMAPEGYELVSDVMNVNVKDAKTYSYNFVNIPLEEIDDPDVPSGWVPIDDSEIPKSPGILPDTGSIFGTFTLIAIGFILILAGTVLIFKRRFIG
nr:SpaA isopeptide-forming pilin-related protein [Sedimentibacter sp.]